MGTEDTEVTNTKPIFSYNENYLGDVLTEPLITLDDAYTHINTESFGNKSRLSRVFPIAFTVNGSNLTNPKLVNFITKLIDQGYSKNGSEKNSPLDYSPSASFKTFKFINKQAYGNNTEKSIIIAESGKTKENKTLNTYLTWAGNFNDGAKSSYIKQLVKKAAGQLRERMKKDDSAIYKFAVWTVAVKKANLKQRMFVDYRLDPSKDSVSQIQSVLFSTMSLLSSLLTGNETWGTAGKEHADYIKSQIDAQVKRIRYNNPDELFIFPEEIEFTGEELYNTLLDLLNIGKLYCENNTIDHKALLKAVFSYITGDVGDVCATTVIDAFQKKFQDVSFKPCVIDKNIAPPICKGNTASDIFNLVSDIINETISIGSATKSSTYLPTMDGYCSKIVDIGERAKVFKSSSYAGDEKLQADFNEALKLFMDLLYTPVFKELSGKTGTAYVFGLTEYCNIIADALIDLFSLDIFDEYNNAIASSFIVNKMLISDKTPLEAEQAELSSAFDKAEFDTGSYQRISLASKDIRQVMRDSEYSLYYLHDYNWSVSLTSLLDMGLVPEDFQYITIYELQPERTTSYKRLVEGAIKTISDLYSKVAQTGGLLDGAIKTLGSGIFNSAMSLVSAKTTAEFSTNTAWVDTLIDGDWVGQYNVPFPNKNFLKTGSGKSWKIGNLADSSDFLKNDLTVNVQDVPTWQYDPDIESQSLETTFYLLNETFEDYQKNLKFLYAITMGSYWIQDTPMTYRPPNLYRVVCPNRFIWVYASMDIDVNFEGKVRKYSKSDAEKMFGAEKDSFKPFNHLIADDCNIPEAFSVKLSIKSITPNAFNVQAAFLTNSLADSKIIPNINNIGERVGRTSLYNAFEKLLHGENSIESEIKKTDTYKAMEEQARKEAEQKAKEDD